jgi:predicted nucleotidyltransferase
MSLYSKLGDTLLKDIMADIIAASNDLQIEFFGVGALARNTWYIENDLPARGTKDVDFGVYIPNEAVYSQLKNKLIEDYNYVASSTNAFCLLSPHEIPIDLLPFGEIENNGKVLVDGKGLTTIRLDGFKEVHLNGLKQVNIEGDLFNVCTIPSVVLLKLIAFDDRPEQRAKDPLDISSIFKVYPDLESDFIWEAYSFLYEGKLSHDAVAVKVIGFEVRKLIEGNIALLDRVNGILDDAVSGRSKLATHMIEDGRKETVAIMIERLMLFQQGLNKER